MLKVYYQGLGENNLVKEEILTYDGVISDLLPNATFRVRLENGHTIVAVASGKLRKNRIRCLQNDKVKIEISPYDLSRGRISYRY